MVKKDECLQNQLTLISCNLKPQRTEVLALEDKVWYAFVRRPHASSSVDGVLQLLQDHPLELITNNSSWYKILRQVVDYDV